MKILFVEDDIWLRDMYCDVLKSNNMEIFHTDDAQKAIRILDDTEINCVVMDMMLPGRSGVEILHEMRSYDDWDAIPVLMLSTMNPQDFPVDMDWSHYGVTEYLYKPHVSPLELVSKISKYTGLYAATTN